MGIAIIGLGYVGLPLAHAFSFKYRVVGFDISKDRVDELNDGFDKTLELNKTQMIESVSNNILFTNNIDDISDCKIYIITVPTPIDEDNKPDLTSLKQASELVGNVLNKKDIVIYESTVYPGATEEDCVPILEKHSKLKFNRDFYCGYSPERINPGDKNHTVTKITKITSGSTPSIAKKIDNLYSSIISAGTYLAPSIKVAEAAKVIENSQRDINIAFINELAVIFKKLDIDTKEVLDAARTKWNFLPFSPGLVGGHCIGIDPYYLTYKAQQVGYKPEVILAGRKINDNMGPYVASQIVKLAFKKGLNIQEAKVLVLGITFKENCPDIRNSKVIDVINELKEFGCKVEVSDYWADAREVRKKYNIVLTDNLNYESYNIIVLAVAHDNYRMIKLNNHKQVVFDIKSILEFYDERL
jgi:UDP-N-acetyl-D-glucosamine/UDP-N-acetyl-D-galactosamine dehydrogenase